MTNNNKVCKVCGEYSGKRVVCIICKKTMPYVSSAKGQYPFNRKNVKIKNAKKN